MKKRFMVGALITGLVLGEVSAEGRTFTVDSAAQGAVLPNTAQMLTAWNVPRFTEEQLRSDRTWDVRDFAEWVEIMAATGGNAARDGYRDPQNRAVTDDYEFSRLVAGCRGILALGMKPYLKLGNVPMKLSSNIGNGDFAMNVRPPDDYAAYARYMEACAKALLAAFGKAELLTWRFAVLTEYENAGWFQDASGDPERTFQAYCLLYEKTVEAFGRVISPDLTFGVHAMAVTEGLWDERRFFAFVAVRHLPLRFVTASFYDERAGKFTNGLTLPKTIAHLRAGAEKAGLRNLFYGVDEGRLLYGTTRNRKNDNLNMRIVGDTYQAAYDARIARQLFDSGAAYFAAWGYLSGPHTWFEGLPSVSFHVARELAAFKGMKRLAVAASGAAPAGVEAEAVAALAPDAQSLKVMAYAFTNDLFAAGTMRVAYSLKLPTAWQGRAVTVTRAQVDDEANWFDEWRADRKRLGIGDDAFSWSPDDPAPMSGVGLTRKADRDRFQTELQPRYRRCAELKSEVRRVDVPADGVLSLAYDLPYNAAQFLTLSLQPCVAQDADAALRTVRARADRRIVEIRAAPNGTVPDAVPRRYMSAATGDDAADGLTPATAWRTVARLNRETLAPGTFVLFERGGVYRGSVRATAGVTLTAYGTGVKPRLYASPEDGADPKKWVRTENPKVWAYDIGHADVGTLVFDGGAAHAVKILLKTDPKTGQKSDLRTWRPFKSYRDIAGDLHFWHDYYPKGTGKVYLVSDRNPGERFKCIEFNVCQHGVAVAGDDVTVDNLFIAYTGAHGVGAGSCRNLTVKNCEFAWIGGSIMSEDFAGRPFPTRFGNAVEIFGFCDGYVVSNNYIRQVYDTGITHQFNVGENQGLKRFDQRNITYADNVIENCNFSIEYFLVVPKGNQSLMENVRITDNLMFDAGYGFCEQRPDPWVGTHVMAYYIPNKNRARNFLIRGNAMCHSRRTLVEIASSLPSPDGGTSLPRLEDNLLIGKQGGDFGYVADKDAKVLRCDDPKCPGVLDARGAGNKLAL